MKLKSAKFENFKGIRQLSIDFSDPHSTEPRQLTCIIGDNGSGKTTVLQAIGLLLSLATRRTRQPSEFAWHGFLPERLSSLGPTHVELTVVLKPEEIALTVDLFEEWKASHAPEWLQSHTLVPPSTEKEVTLVYEGGKVSSPGGFAAQNQLLGRYYIKALSKNQPAKRGLFSKIGDVFWFDQHRNLGSILDGQRSDGDSHAVTSGTMNKKCALRRGSNAFD